MQINWQQIYLEPYSRTYQLLAFLQEQKKRVKAVLISLFILPFLSLAYQYYQFNAIKDAESSSLHKLKKEETVFLALKQNEAGGTNQKYDLASRNKQIMAHLASYQIQLDNMWVNNESGLQMNLTYYSDPMSSFALVQDVAKSELFALQEVFFKKTANGEIKTDLIVYPK